MAVDQLDQSDKAGEGKGSEAKPDLSNQSWDAMKTQGAIPSDSGKSAQTVLDDKGFLIIPPCYDGVGRTTPPAQPQDVITSKAGQIPDVPDPEFNILKDTRTTDYGDPGFTPGKGSPSPDTSHPGDAGKTGGTVELKDKSSIDRATAIDEAKHAGVLGDNDKAIADPPYEPVVIHRHDDSPDTATWTDPDGRNIEVQLGQGDNVSTGTIYDASGNAVGTVTGLDGNHIVYDDEHGTHLKTIDVGRKGIQVKEVGEYNPDEATVTEKGAGYKQTDTLAPGGRQEVTSDNGDTHWSTDRGDYAQIVKSTGDVLVSHKDGTTAMLHADGSIDMTDEKGAKHKDKLSPEEQHYLKKHPDVDARDLAEIHRRFYPHQDKIDAFYHSLEKIDSAKNLDDAQRSALRRDLMHHVAAPQDIYQGSTESCNVSVIERDLAMNDPKKYVDIVRTAVSDGVVHTADGDVHVEPYNLTMRDSSGRDLASRIFQTASLHAEFWPSKDYVNTPDGAGQLNPGDAKHNKGADHEVPFDGLMPAEVADLRYKLTGEQKSIGFIQNGDQLHDALKKNGIPMTIAVDSTAPPFHADTPGDHKANHVVSIVGVTEGPPRKYLIENQWGPKNDHSTPETAISEDDLVKNMKSGGRVGTVLVPSITEGHKKGDRRQLVANGKVVPDFDILAEQQKNRWDAEKKT